LEHIEAALGPLQSLTQIYLIANGNERPNNAPGNWPLLRDSSGLLAERYGVTHPCICLIRPDGYIGLRSNAENLAAGLADFVQKFSLLLVVE
jgi:hypothetical protein